MSAATAQQATDRTTGQQFTAAVRTSFHIGPRTLDRRDKGNLRAAVLECITNAVWHDGYYGLSGPDCPGQRSAYGSPTTSTSTATGSPATCGTTHRLDEPVAVHGAARSDDRRRRHQLRCRRKVLRRHGEAAAGGSGGQTVAPAEGCGGAER